MTDSTNQPSVSHLPVETIDTRSSHEGPKPGIALCLSGGGYRAMLFHVGSLWRLNEAACSQNWTASPASRVDRLPPGSWR